ncbi:MAG: magnesium transporter [Myxococcota bacterium]|jgi:magnesium transporter
MPHSVSERTRGLAPGTPVLTDGDSSTTRIRVYDYGPDHFSEVDGATVAEARQLRGADSVTWVDVVGLRSVATIQELCEAFGVHPLSVEDVVDVSTRPKLDDYGDFLFFVTKVVHLVTLADSPGGSEMTAEQVSIVVGPRFVLTFQEQEEDVFEGVRRRLTSADSRIRGRGADYLAYSLLDALVDGLRHVVEHMGELVETLEEEVLTRSDDMTPTEIHGLKQDLLFLRKALHPTRDALAALIRSESDLLSESTRLYLRDAQDHLLQSVDLVGVYREITIGMMDVYLSMVAHRTNEVMRVLTVLTAIFVPATFIAGVYGMNFDTMPELHHPLGYPVAWAVMTVLALIQLGFFRRRGWL